MIIILFTEIIYYHAQETLLSVTHLLFRSYVEIFLSLTSISDLFFKFDFYYVNDKNIKKLTFTYEYAL